jgi:hypothetical protein
MRLERVARLKGGQEEVLLPLRAEFAPRDRALERQGDVEPVDRLPPGVRVLLLTPRRTDGQLTRRKAAARSET